jgi:hypothetical protein
MPRRRRSARPGSPSVKADERTRGDGDVAVELTCLRDLDLGILVGSDLTPTDDSNLAINITEAVDVQGSPTEMSGALAHRPAGDATNDSNSRLSLRTQQPAGAVLRIA